MRSANLVNDPVITLRRHPLFCDYCLVTVPPCVVEFNDLPSVNEE